MVGGRNNFIVKVFKQNLEKKVKKMCCVARGKGKGAALKRVWWYEAV